MSIKSLAAAAAANPDLKLNVAAACRDAGVAPKTFYKWKKRFQLDGEAGLEERSRRPLRVPAQTEVDVEDQIVRLRKELCDAGLDHGADTIGWHLARDPEFAGRVPARSTIYRILVRRGQVTPEPKKKPRRDWKRFEAPAPNEMWQIDAMDWTTASGTVSVFNIIDDHSRVLIASRAVPSATTDQAWAVFCQGAQQWGLPAGVLSDNGLCFSGKLRGFEVFFEHQLREAGITPITSRPYHPQTTGKVERAQQTIKKRLRKQPAATGLAELQTQLDDFADIYNNHRPHQGIARQIPAHRWHATPPATNANHPIDHPDYRHRTHHVTVTSTGCANITGYIRIHIGVEHAGQHATITTNGTWATVFINNHLIRHLTIDHTRTYQPSGRPRGGPRRARIGS